MNRLLHYYCFHYSLDCYFHCSLGCCLTKMDSNFIVRMLRLQFTLLNLHHHNLQIQKENLRPSLRFCHKQNKLLLLGFLKNLNSLDDELLPILKKLLIFYFVVRLKQIELLPILKKLKDHGLIKLIIKEQDFEEMLLQFKVDFIIGFA